MSGPTPAPRVLLDRGELAAHVAHLAGRIAADHPDGVVLVGVLKGAVVFLADLARDIRGVDVQLDFHAIPRYAPDSGRVRCGVSASSADCNASRTGARGRSTQMSGSR